MKPRVTVVIPCFNAARFLRETLESALNQSHAPIEVLVIDDGSTDQSAAIAASYGPPVRVISQTNQGESVARNRGIEEARGSWIAFLDADDIWLPEKLERQTCGRTTRRRLHPYQLPSFWNATITSATCRRFPPRNATPWSACFWEDRPSAPRP